MGIVNLEMMKNPLNWVTVFLMVLIFALFADVVASHYKDISTAAAMGS